MNFTMNTSSVLRHTVLAVAVLSLAACRSMHGYAPIKTQGALQAVVDPMGRPMPHFNGLRYSWGGGAYTDRYQIVVDLNDRQMAWSRRTYQSKSLDSDELTGVKYKKLSAEGAQKIIQAANVLWASKTPLKPTARNSVPGDLTLYAEGSVLESCCSGDGLELAAPLRAAVLEAFSQK